LRAVQSVDVESAKVERKGDRAVPARVEAIVEDGQSVPHNAEIAVSTGNGSLEIAGEVHEVLCALHRDFRNELHITVGSRGGRQGAVTPGGRGGCHGGEEIVLQRAACGGLLSQVDAQARSVRRPARGCGAAHAIVVAAGDARHQAVTEATADSSYRTLDPAFIISRVASAYACIHAGSVTETLDPARFLVTQKCVVVCNVPLARGARGVDGGGKGEGGVRRLHCAGFGWRCKGFGVLFFGDAAWCCCVAGCV